MSTKSDPAGTCPDGLTDLDRLRAEVAAKGFDLTLADKSILDIRAIGFRSGNLLLALVATNVLLREQPVTLRGLMYLLVSAGWLPSTDLKHYQKLGRLMTRLREDGIVRYHWIVDGVRNTIKPPSWSGIEDFTITVRDAYRMDFWARLPVYVHVICEKDAIAGTLSPVTREYDVRLSPLRGYSSLSFAFEISETWNATQKPIYCYFLGDFDASGFDLERDIREKLHRHTKETHPYWLVDDEFDEMMVCERTVVWQRLGVNRRDFRKFNLLPLKVKRRDSRAKQFIEEHGTEAAELDALPATELRQRIRDAIESHIPLEEWERLQEIEQQERESFNAVLAQLPKAG